MNAGYSKRPLVDKLGLKAEMRAVILNPPDGYLDLLAPMPPHIHLLTNLAPNSDFIQAFFENTASFHALLLACKASLKPNGMLWISWRKGQKAAGMLNENIVREAALLNGLVDVKVAAIDAVWSGLKLVIPVRERPSL